MNLVVILFPQSLDNNDSLDNDSNLQRLQSEKKRLPFIRTHDKDNYVSALQCKHNSITHFGMWTGGLGINPQLSTVPLSHRRPLEKKDNLNKYVLKYTKSCHVP
ncbi:Hypothetical predicted protein [Xyrichtys novacula]|uniref:Uncharacterized protein n=1 Tax=Xyrichtys novacula TaxID=13765 RepID=A0AAV1F096_XYRNO|nr:Hypothetical predicted protein [Xyrichtys novacula]